MILGKKSMEFYYVYARPMGLDQVSCAKSETILSGSDGVSRWFRNASRRSRVPLSDFGYLADSDLEDLKVCDHTQENHIQ